MAGRPRIGAVLIDLDGVIRHWPRPYDAPVRPGQRRVEDEVFTVAFAPELLQQAITGRITHHDWLAETVRQLSRDWPADHARDAVDDWADALPTINPTVRDLVAGWRRAVPVVLITNATDRLDRDLAIVGLDDAFDDVINSFAIGHAKPDPAIFAAAVGRAGVPADRTLFIDDSPGNVAAAMESGLIGYRFDGDTDRLRTFVARHLS